MRQLTDLISELKRRRVFRVAVVYTGVAFFIIQVVDCTFELMGSPERVRGLMFIWLDLAFPPI